MKIFLAGATGAIGRRLVPLLLNAKHYVIGTTRSTTKADGLRAAGVEPMVVDVFDAPALHVDAAAWAAVLAIGKARRGIYNIAEPSEYLSTERARRELGFDSSVRANAAA